VHFSAYALALPLLSNFLEDHGGSASCKCFPLLTLFCNFVNVDIVIFENDNFSTKVEFFWCASSSSCLCERKKSSNIDFRKSILITFVILKFGLINKIRQVFENPRPNIKKVSRERHDYKSCDAPTKTIETQHLSLSTLFPSLPCGEFPSGTAWPALRFQMRPPQPETCDKFIS
jgi:hypothetical protein